VQHEAGSSELKVVADQDEHKLPVQLRASEASFCFPDSSSENTLVQSLGNALSVHLY
jgi:hypothetical protein